MGPRHEMDLEYLACLLLHGGFNTTNGNMKACELLYPLVTDTQRYWFYQILALILTPHQLWALGVLYAISIVD